MTDASAVQDGDLIDGIADLESKIETLVRWARAVRDLGGCSHDVSADGLAVIGEAMLTDAHVAKARWQKCFALVCDLQGGNRRLPRTSASYTHEPNTHPEFADPEEAGR